MSRCAQTFMPCLVCCYFFPTDGVNKNLNADSHISRYARTDKQPRKTKKPSLLNTHELRQLMLGRKEECASDQLFIY